MTANQLTQDMMEAFNERYTAYIESLSEQRLFLNFHEDADNELLYEDLSVFDESSALVIHHADGDCEVCRFDLSEINGTDQEVLERVILHWYNHDDFDIYIDWEGGTGDT